VKRGKVRGGTKGATVSEPQWWGKESFHGKAQSQVNLRRKKKKEIHEAQKRCQDRLLNREEDKFRKPLKQESGQRTNNDPWLPKRQRGGPKPADHGNQEGAYCAPRPQEKKKVQLPRGTRGQVRLAWKRTKGGRRKNESQRKSHSTSISSGLPKERDKAIFLVAAQCGQLSL